LDAGYRYALYDPVHPDTSIDTNEMRRELLATVASPLPSEGSRAIADVVRDWPALQRELEAKKRELDASPANVESQIRARLASPSTKISPAIAAGQQHFATIKCPVLAIFADPHDFGPGVKGAALIAAQTHDKRVDGTSGSSL
jgi:non-heme chloroperoxidase